MNMKKLSMRTIGGAVLVALTALATSCSDVKQEVKQFAADFATKVSNNQKDSLLAVWPDVAKADSLALTFSPDSIVVEETDREGQFKVSFGQRADIVVNKGEDGNISIIESRGLFAYPDRKLSFAKLTGWIEKGMNDLEIAERFQDTLFVASLGNSILKEIKNSLVIVDDHYDPMELSGLGHTTWHITVHNKSPYDISKTDYHVLGVLENENGRKTSKSIPGIDISSNSTSDILYKVNISNIPAANAPKIVLDINTEDVVTKYYIPKGNEYKEYLSKVFK